MGVVSRYEWDAGNLTKCQSHGVTVAEIEHVLDGDPFLVPDYGHSGAEERTIAIGSNRVGRPIFVVFTIRVAEGREIVRPISARYMHKKEIERWAEERSRS
ncbi:MAG: BrnT family toxin [Devosia sp.]|jgi:uncharacterized DUF497 family protein|uniref:BrnT family toxin n=1 Tax=Devosia sp. TaxID=1871048 RepID=UPI001A3BEE34|nr:BrnT family toxin [Devosia sp.]MBL8596792.1 BrnT family toxin [Devosia sp.]